MSKKKPRIRGVGLQIHTLGSGTSSSIRINSGGVQSDQSLGVTEKFLANPHLETPQVTSRHVRTFSWQFTLNLPSQCEFVSLLEVA